MATALSLLRHRVEASLFLAVPALAWLLLDKRLADDGPAAA
jgi:hypothetical protein